MTETTTPDTAERRRFDRPRVPHTTFMRELTMADGRKLTVDRRSVAMLCEADPQKFNGRKISIVGFRIPGANPVPVQEGYHDLKSWWRGDGANGKAATP
jgi:hypothetical protein